MISLKFDAGLISANVDITDYIGCLEEVCFGVSTSAPGDHPLRNGTPLLLQSEAGPWPPGDEWYSSVITFEYWSLLLPDEKWKELFGLEFKSRSGSRDTIVQEALGTLAPGTFRLKQGTRFGNPLVWLTPKTALETHLKQYGKAEKANAARDFLGLVHRRENHHLVAIHVPASVLGGRNSARPSFADAGGHRRFMAASLTFPFARAWGQTLNLEAFEISQNLADGGAERVCGYLTDAVTTTAEFGFTYLGQLTTSRGTSLDPTGKVCFGGDADYAERQVARDLGRFRTVAGIL